MSSNQTDIGLGLSHHQRQRPKVSLSTYTFHTVMEHMQQHAIEKKINVHIYNNQWKVRKMWQKRQRPSGLYQWRMQNPKFEVAMSHVTYVIAPFMQRLTPYRHLTLCMDTDFYYRSFNITWKKHKAFLWEKLNENFQLRPPGLITFRLNWLLETNLLFIQF